MTAELVDDSGWDEALLRCGPKDAIIAAVPANFTLYLRHDPRWRGVIAYDEFAECIVTTRSPPWDEVDAPANCAAGPWTDVDTGRLSNWFARVAGLRASMKACEHAVMVAAECNRWHPVRNYARSLKWDGKQRLPTFLSDYLGCDDTAYTRGIGVRWMISAIARVMEPGCQVDCTLILEGAQGIGKTSALRELVPVRSWYADTGITIGDKDSYQNIHGVWIYGLDELDSLRRAVDQTKIKNFMTATTDRYRPSFGRLPKAIPRQNVFAGTTNEVTYFSDTHNRRYLPVRLVRRPDLVALRRDRDQLWAEAASRYDSHERWHIDTAELQILCEAEQADRRESDPWEDAIQAELAKPNLSRKEGVTVDELLHLAIGLEVADRDKKAQTRVTNILANLGYVRGNQKREGGKHVRRWSLGCNHVTSVTGDLLAAPRSPNGTPLPISSYKESQVTLVTEGEQ